MQHFFETRLCSDSVGPRRFGKRARVVRMCARSERVSGAGTTVYELRMWVDGLVSRHPGGRGSTDEVDVLRLIHHPGGRGCT